MIASIHCVEPWNLKRMFLFGNQASRVECLVVPRLHECEKLRVCIVLCLLIIICGN